MNYKELFITDIDGNKNEVILTLNCYAGEFNYREKIKKDEEYVLLKTATSTMDIDKYSGNVSDISGNRARIIIEVEDRIIDLYDIRTLDKLSKMDRVLLSEHLNINGDLEWVATKSPLKTGDLNFLTLAKRNKTTGEFTYKKRIDIVTGETREEILDGNS